MWVVGMVERAVVVCKRAVQQAGRCVFLFVLLVLGVLFCTCIVTFDR